MHNEWNGIPGTYYIGCEFWEIECQGSAVTITLRGDGSFRDAQEWRDGVAVQLSAKEAQPVLEAALAHREALDALEQQNSSARQATARLQLVPTSGSTMEKGISFPVGWDGPRVQMLLAHYEGQSGDEAVAEDEAAFGGEQHTVMEVPTVLVPTMRELIARYRKQHPPK